MLNINTDIEASLLVARWDAPGIAGGFETDATSIFYQCTAQNCWLWLVDLRQHGGLSQYSVNNFFQTRVTDTALRAPEGQQLRVALLIGPDFPTVRAEVPDEDYQQRHHFAAQVFTHEGEARQWLEQLPG